MATGAVLIPAAFVLQTFRLHDSALAVSLLRFLSRRLADTTEAVTDRERRNAVLTYVASHLLWLSSGWKSPLLSMSDVILSLITLSRQVLNSTRSA